MFYAVSFAVGYGYSLVAGSPVWPEAFTGFVHTRLFNQYQVWTLPLVVLPAAILSARGGRGRYGLHGLEGLWYALLFASGGRGATLAVAGSLVLMPLLYRRRAVRWLRLQGAAAVGGLALYVVLFQVLADNHSVFSRLQHITNGSGRLELWSMALEMIARRPVLGEGPVHFAQHLNTHGAHPHNAPLQWAAEWGLPAALLLLGLVGWGLYAWVHGSRQDMDAADDPDRDLLFVAVTASLTTAGAYALLSGVVVMPLSQTLMVLVVGWAIALYRGGRHPELGRHPTARSGVGLAVVVGASWLAIGCGVVPDVLSLEE